MGAGGEAGGWDTAPICSSDMAYIRNSISGVRLRAGCEDAGRAMMRPMARHSGEEGKITSRERGVFFNNADVLPYRSSRVLIINPFSSLLVKLIWMRFIFATTFLMDVSHLLIYTRWSLSRSHHAAILHWCFLIPRVLRELVRTPQTTAAICGIIGWKWNPCGVFHILWNFVVLFMNWGAVIKRKNKKAWCADTKCDTWMLRARQTLR